MGKKSRARNANKQYISKGERRSVSRSAQKAANRERDYAVRALHRLDAFAKGRPVKGYEEDERKRVTNFLTFGIKDEENA